MTKKTKKILASLFLGAVVLLAAAFFYVSGQLDSVETQGQKVFEIEAGQSADQVVSGLYEEGLIKNETLFYLWMKYFDDPSSLQAGQYVIDLPVEKEALMALLKKGKITKQTVKVTLPEGLKVDQIIQRFTDKKMGQKEVFEDLCKKTDWDYDFLPASLPSGVDYALEGFLFPDTYEFYLDASEETIIRKLLDRFEDVYDEELQERASQRGMSSYEVITMASIVEREAKVKEERPIIAGVFYNRLDMGMALQSCATVQYLFEQPKERLLTVDTEIESPYNTYLNPGLPIGPIASPGQEAIRASLWPADHDYLYFNANADGSHNFNRTYKEHQESAYGD